MTRPVVCAGPGCDNRGVDLVQLGVLVDRRVWVVEAEFVLCSEHGALVSAITEEVEPKHFPTFRITVSGLGDVETLGA